MSIKIAVIGGDGTGPEVVAEGIKVLETVGQKLGIKYETIPFDLGGNRFLKTGELLPDSVLGELKQVDTIFLGAIGHPEVKPGILEKGILLTLRFALDQYINLRPVKLFPGVETPIKNKGPAEINYVVIRENSGGLYTGVGGVSMKGTPHETAVQSMVYSRHQVERCLKYAFDYCQRWNMHNPEKGKTLTLCGKTNVLTHVYDLWERAFHEVGASEFPSIKREYAHVDAITMWMIKNPEWFDVIVTGNMFGDIITDLGAMTQGGMGIAAGGNINPEGVSMFEPIGGSAPKYTGKNLINPLAAISAMAMLLDQMGQFAGAKLIETAISRVTQHKLKGLGAGEMGYSTSEVGDLVCQQIAVAATSE